jgi:hypothetical protein
MAIPIIANIPAIPTTPYIPSLASILIESTWQPTIHSIISKAEDRKVVQNKI